MTPVTGKKVLIFGGTGGIGQGTKQAFEAESAEVIAIGSQTLNLKISSALDIGAYLKRTNPDIIVHSAGVIRANKRNAYYDVFDVNFGSVWRMLSYYQDNPPDKRVNIVVVGSESYSRPSPQYPLYIASKAALVSLVSSLAPRFTGTNVVLNMVNPGKTNTSLHEVPDSSLLTPYEVGREIVRLAKLDTSGNISKFVRE